MRAEILNEKDLFRITGGNLWGNVYNDGLTYAGAAISYGSAKYRGSRKHRR